MTWLEMFRGVVEKDPHRIAATTDRGAVTYRELWDQSAASLDGIPRFGRRRLIVDMEPLSTLQQIIGAWQLGDVPTPILSTLPPVLRELVTQRLANGPQGPDSRRVEDAEGLILTTSGSTGTGKQVVLPLRAQGFAPAALGDLFNLAPGTEVLLATSVARAAGLHNSVLVGLANGWTMHLFKSTTPLPVVQDYMRNRDIHALLGSPALLRFFHAYWNGAPFPSVRLITITSESSSREILEKTREAFPNARILTGYGLTEAGSRVAMLDAEDPRFKPGTIGNILPHFSWKLRQLEGTEPGIGELLLKGPSVFLGYLQDDGSYAGLTEDGYLATGDLMEVSADSCMLYHGRVDNLIKVGGHRVNPFTTEAVIRALPAVSEVRCFAKAHPMLGHVLVAEVEAKPGHSITADDVIKACAGKVEPQQVPREVHLVAAIARTAAGKLPRLAMT